jgi:regulatory protein
VKHARPPADPDSSKAAYAVALGWLGARELSEGQVRDRLARRGYTARAIDPAIRQLIAERTLDDRRAASEVARTEARVRRHGPRRIIGRLVAMRVDRELAKEIVQELFRETDEAELVEQALEKRLRGNTARLADPHERRKLVRYLVGQGFSASEASRLIRKKSREK